MWPWRVKMPTQNLLRLLLLLMLMLRNVLTQGLVKMLKLKFSQDFEAEVWSAFCCWCLSLHKKRESFSKDVGWGKRENKGLRRTENVCCFLTRLMSTLIYNVHYHLPPSGHWLRPHLGWLPLLRCVRRTLTRINGNCCTIQPVFVSCLMSFKPESSPESSFEVSTAQS